MPKTQLRNKKKIKNVAAAHRKNALNAVMHAIAVCNVVPFWQLPAIVYLYAVIVVEYVLDALQYHFFFYSLFYLIPSGLK